MTPFTLAHLSDVHLPPGQGFAPRYWNAKRILGFLNWQRKRKHVHHAGVADALIADAHRINVDHIAITGDLVNLGLPVEYDAALAWLKRVGPPQHVTVVPGNHDVYTRLSGHPGAALWAAYMGSEQETLAFPFVRHVGPLALVGLNSAVETPPFFASGKLGSHQIEVAGEMLERAADDGAIRVVLIHHPPLPGMAPQRRALTDAQHFARMLQHSGAELVLYGHNHREEFNLHPLIAARHGEHIPVAGVPSASAGKAHKHEPLARYNVFTFFMSDRGLRIRQTVRGLQEPGGPVVKLAEKTLELERSDFLPAVGRL